MTRLELYVGRLKIAYEDSIKEVKSFKKTYSGYMEMFPTKVKNLEF